MYEAITNVISSNSCGFDEISSKTIKMIPELMIFWLWHLMNLMLRMGKFPRIIKMAEITSIKKPRELSTQISSYSPINNQQVFEKAVEEVLKKKLTTYFEINNLLCEELHWGR